LKISLSVPPSFVTTIQLYTVYCLACFGRIQLLGVGAIDEVLTDRNRIITPTC
jgi:hypothetical protein